MSNENDIKTMINLFLANLKTTNAIMNQPIKTTDNHETIYIQRAETPPVNLSVLLNNLENYYKAQSSTFP